MDCLHRIQISKKNKDVIDLIDNWISCSLKTGNPELHKIVGEANRVVVYCGIKKIYSLNGNTVVLDVLDLISDKSRCLNNYEVVLHLLYQT